MESAPAGFGMLQLFNSNEDSMRASFTEYAKSTDRVHKAGKKLWRERFARQPAAYWSTCAYLINKIVMKPIVDSLLTFKSVERRKAVGNTPLLKVTVMEARNITQQLLYHQFREFPVANTQDNNITYIAEVKLIAGQRWECVPLASPCCLNPTNYTYSEIPPCVLSPRGFQADMFLYATTKSYVLNIPLIANGVGGNQSKC